jgi:hypothetical protein
MVDFAEAWMDQEDDDVTRKLERPPHFTPRPPLQSGLSVTRPKQKSEAESIEDGETWEKRTNELPGRGILHDTLTKPLSHKQLAHRPRLPSLRDLPSAPAAPRRSPTLPPIPAFTAQPNNDTRRPTLPPIPAFTQPPKSVEPGLPPIPAFTKPPPATEPITAIESPRPSRPKPPKPSGAKPSRPKPPKPAAVIDDLADISIAEHLQVEEALDTVRDASPYALEPSHPLHEPAPPAVQFVPAHAPPVSRLPQPTFPPIDDLAPPPRRPSGPPPAAFDAPPPPVPSAPPPPMASAPPPPMASAPPPPPVPSAPPPPMASAPPPPMASAPPPAPYYSAPPPAQAAFDPMLWLRQAAASPRGLAAGAVVLLALLVLGMSALVASASSGSAPATRIITASDPTGTPVAKASVFVDGSALCTELPCVIEVSATHWVTVRASGFHAPAAQAISNAADSPKRVHFELRPSFQQSEPAKSVAAAPSAAPEPEPEPEPEPVAVAQPEQQDEPAPSKAPARKSVAPAPAPAPRPVSRPAVVGGTGRLNINSIPASNVVLDGRPMGQTPQMGIKVSPGSHTVIFVRGKKRVVRGTVVKAGQTSVVSARL